MVLRTSPQRRYVRILAVSIVSLGVAGAGIAAAIRESDAETPQGAAASPYATTSAESAANTTASAAPTTGNRIRFGMAVSSDPTGEAPGGPTTRGAAFADYYADQRSAVTSGDYPVRQAAGEAPIAKPTTALSAGDPFSRNASTTSGSASTAPPRSPMPPPSNPLPSAPLPTAPMGAPPTNAGTTGANAGDRYATPAATAPVPAPAASMIPAAPATSANRTTIPEQTTERYAPPTAAATQPQSSPRPFPAVPAPRELPPAVSPQAAAPQSTPSSAGSNGTPSAVAASGSGRPGEKALEGTQAPTLHIEKFAPPEIQVGKPAVFEILVRNTGTTVANNVEIHDLLPQGTQLTNTTPKASQGRNGELVWTLGAMRPGDEATVQVEVMPTTEGEIGSIATVHFAAAASARTICTKPEIAIEVSAPRSVMVGDEVPLKIRVFNSGTGAATGVYLTEVVPPGMEHAAGGELEYEIGDLQPNETRELELSLRAVKPGPCTNLIQGKGDGRVAAETKTQFDIVAASLNVEIDGPKRRFLDRQATYTVSLTNPGTAAAREIELATYLPRGMQFIDADNHGEYDSETHSVRWMLEELPPQQRGSVTLTALPVEPGQQLFRVESTADRGISARKEETVLVEGAVSLVFQVVDTVDPVEVGGETEYEIVVANQGSKEATNVQLSVTLPEGFKAVDADGPSKFTAAGRQIQFQALPQLPAKSETTFRVRAQCQRAGDHRCLVQLTSDDSKLPVTKEEGTRVYAEE
ncbi:MAG: hypothetical protein C0483_12915 [Pirellula sp.]|nr:hypothetical protein [Pirellula sp.]